MCSVIIFRTALRIRYYLHLFHWYTHRNLGLSVWHSTDGISVQKCWLLFIPSLFLLLIFAILWWVAIVWCFFYFTWRFTSLMLLVLKENHLLSQTILVEVVLPHDIKCSLEKQRDTFRDFFVLRKGHFSHCDFFRNLLYNKLSTNFFRRHCFSGTRLFLETKRGKNNISSCLS